MSAPPMETPTPISIDNDCVDTLTLELLAVVTDNCAGPFTIEIMDNNGQSLGDTITSSMIGNVYLVMVSDLSGQNVMTAILVLDKQKPQIESCPDDITFACTFDIDDYDATDEVVVVECSQWTISTFDEVIFSAQCQGDTTAQYRRHYLVLDEYGNVDTCTQLLTLIKANLDDVEFPPNLTGANALACFPAPDTSCDNTGFPTVMGGAIENGIFCNLSFTKSDVVVPICSGGYKIFRTFTVYDWCDNNNSIDSVQTIEVLDLTPPVVVAPPDMTLSTNTDVCAADVFLQAATLSEDCSNITSVRVQWPFGTMNTNGGNIFGLPVGVHIIEYFATNDCDSIGRDTMLITIVDNEPPTAVCNLSLSIPVAANGFALVPAETLDGGSFDNCGPVFFKVRRMTAPLDYDCYNEGNPFNNFDDHLKLCCEDIPNNNIMVILRVYDVEPVDGPVSDTYLTGRWNECMMEIQVQDKLPPTIVCPSDLTVSCQFDFDPQNLSVFGSVATDPAFREQICFEDGGNPNTIGVQCVGLDGLASDNCSVMISEDKLIDIDSCGIGSITRTFTATDNGGFTASCTQHIKIINYTPFTENGIVWPLDFETTNVCDVDSLDPEDLPTIHSEPVLSGGECDLVTFNYKDNVFDFSQFDQACFKIIRTWTVIDWCQFDNDGSGIWVHNQIIKSLNNMPPTFGENFQPIVVCTDDPNCGPTTVLLSASATDDCSSANTLSWKYEVDVFNDQVVDFAPPSSNGGSVSFDYTFPIGTHRVLFTVLDKCGNKISQEQFVTVESCIGPSAKCLNGLSTSLMPMDMDGDGTADWGMVTIWASDFDAGSDHQCGVGVTLAFSTDPNDKSMVFDCSDVGINTIGLYVIDDNGLTDVCFTTIDIQDNSVVCPPTGGNNGFISGQLETESADNVASAMIYLNGSELAPIPTTAEGVYAFPEMPFGGNYEVSPLKDGDDINGVSTLDLLAIQKHLLGISYLDSPYKLIAADANHSGSITAIDILELRKLILGIYDELPSNTSWRFVDAAYQFIDPNNPLQENFPESYVILPFDQNMIDVDFIGVKIGDVNNSAQANLDESTIQIRGNAEPLLIMYSDGEKEGFTFSTKNSSRFDGLQFTMTWDPNEVEVLEVIPSELITRSHMNLNRLQEGLLSVAWNSTTDQFLDQPSDLFTIITNQQDRVDASTFKLSSSLTEKIAYDDLGRSADIVLKGVMTDKGLEFKLFQNHPNPFSNETVVRFQLPGKEKVELNVYNLNGQKLYSSKIKGFLGMNEVKIEKENLRQKGVLIYEIKTKDYVKTRRMIIE